ncbi:ANL family adenylate-forming protein [Dongshaea marina]|uniref:ANL family adenylate-forming protein n=1 Tax=Dongshaea marina TaxID=2047966 RepID=UPI000D3E05C5|nr:fatty acid--CoA ligase family protein [Dongshaea marina]
MINSLKNFDDKIAIVYKGNKYSYDELHSEIIKINNNVISGRIEKGDVVAILSDYSFESIALLISLHMNKNVIVPITSKHDDEINDRLKESFCNKKVIVDNGYIVDEVDSPTRHEMIDRLRDLNHSGLVLFSSGSTGKPKAMIHDFDNLVDTYKNKKSKSINILLFLMFDHIGGINTLLNALLTGATMIIPEDRGVDTVCSLMQDYKIRVLPSSPTFLNLIRISKADKRYDLSNIRMISYGTESMPEHLLVELKRIFPKAKLLQTFGTSETGIAKTSSKSSSSTLMRIDDPNLKFKIIDGELWLKSKTQVMGYLNSSMDCFTDDGWFKTGDVVEVSSDGFIKIVGRCKEVINIGGEKVLPTEIESILLEMPEISDALVKGIPNAITGQTVYTEIVLSEEGKLLDSRKLKSQIRKFCLNKIDKYKVPTKIVFCDRTNFSSRFKKMRTK